MPPARSIGDPSAIHRREMETRAEPWLSARHRPEDAILSSHPSKMKLPTNRDFAYGMMPMKIVSWPLGTWPLQEYNFATGLRSVVALLLLLLMMLILHTEIYLDHGNAEKNLDAVVLMACGVLAITKVACFRFRPEGLIANFVSAARDYQELNEDERRAIVKRHAYMARIATSANILFFSNFSAVTFLTVPLFAGENDDADNFNQTRKSLLSYPIPSDCIMELLQVSGNMNVVVYAGEFLLLLVLAAGNLGSDSLFFGIVFHLCGQVEVLKMNLGRSFDDKENSPKRFDALIRRHHHLLALANHLNDSIGFVLVLQLFSSCLLISISGFQFILSLNVHNAVMLMKTFIAVCVLLTQMFAYSYVGEYSKNQFGAIGNYAYSSDWYNAPSKLSRNILFVLMKAQTPVHLRAGRFFVVNLETYMSILRTSMSYLSILRLMIAE